MSDYLEQGENKVANVTHSFRPIIKFLALCIGEYRGRGVVFAVFRHSCVVVAVVDGDERSLDAANGGRVSRPAHIFAEAGRDDLTVCSPRKLFHQNEK
jgi:hypothetical protein